ncbi:MAG: hypothetical protein AB7K36_23840, partial [Chloroflexota bacterium]
MGFIPRVQPQHAITLVHPPRLNARLPVPCYKHPRRSGGTPPASEGIVAEIREYPAGTPFTGTIGRTATSSTSAWP